MTSKKRGGLGKGLAALGLNMDVVRSMAKAKDSSDTSSDAVRQIPLASIEANRYQPRANFDKAAMEELARSIKVYGVLQPVLVRKLPHDRYELIAGERRLRGARLAGLKKIPALIREYNDAELSEIALIENIQREDLNAIEEAHAYQCLMQTFDLTQETISEKVGRSRSHIANFLRLLKLSPKVQSYIANGSLSMGQAKPLLALDDAELQETIADRIQSDALSARQAEVLVKRLLTKKNHDGKQKQVPVFSEDIYIKDAVEKLKEMLGTKVMIRPGKKKSKIEIEFYTIDDLERILEAITEGNDEDKRANIDALHYDSSRENFTV